MPAIDVAETLRVAELRNTFASELRYRPFARVLLKAEAERLISGEDKGGSLMHCGWIALLLIYGQLCASEKADRIRQLENKFVPPCCWRDSLATHRSPEAQRMRAKVAELIEQGLTDQEVVELFTDRFGERILREPSGVRGRWLYILPPVTVLAGLLLLLRFLRLSLKRQCLTGIEGT